jgi:hypothetical protein
VVNGRDSRKEVADACHRGEDAIVELLQSWLQRVPMESREIVELLEMSCKDYETTDDSTTDPKIDAYLKRPSLDMAALIKAKFTQLVSDEGMNPNEAAVQAIELVTSQQPDKVTPLDGMFTKGTTKDSSPEEYVGRILTSTNGREDLQSLLSTTIKYLENAKREPWNPRFRSFKLSNKVADRITRVPNGLDLLCSLGMEVSSTSEDFLACIPLAADLEEMHGKLAELLEKNS